MTLPKSLAKNSLADKSGVWGKLCLVKVISALYNYCILVRHCLVQHTYSFIQFVFLLLFVLWFPPVPPSHSF